MFFRFNFDKQSTLYLLNVTTKDTGRFQCGVYSNNNTISSSLTLSNDSLLNVMQLLLNQPTNNFKNNQKLKLDKSPIEFWINLRQNEKILLDCLFENLTLVNWFISLNKNNSKEMDLFKTSKIIENKVIISNKIAYLFDAQTSPTHSEIECKAMSSYFNDGITQKKKFIISVKGLL